MKVEAVLATKGREVATTDPKATLAQAAQKLKLEGIGALVVLDGWRVAGIIEHRGEASDIKVADVMTRDVIFCSPEDNLTRVLEVMTRRRVRHLPVMLDGKLLGLVSIGDAVKHRLDELELEAAVLRDAYMAGH